MEEQSRMTQTSPGVGHKSTQTVSRRGLCRATVEMLFSVWPFRWLGALLEQFCGLLLRFMDLVAPDPAAPCRRPSPTARRNREGRKRASSVEQVLSRVLLVGLMRSVVGMPSVASFGTPLLYSRGLGKSPNKQDGKGRKQSELLQIDEDESDASGEGDLSDASSFKAEDLLPSVGQASIAESATPASLELNESRGSTIVQDTSSEDEGDEKELRKATLSALMGDDLPDEDSVDDPSYVVSTSETLDSDEVVDSEASSEASSDRSEASSDKAEFMNAMAGLGKSPNKQDGKGSKRKQSELLQIDENESDASGEGDLSDASSFKAEDLLPSVGQASIAESATPASLELNESRGSTIVQDTSSEDEGDEEELRKANLSALMGDDLPDEDSFDDPSYVVSTSETLDSDEVVDSEASGDCEMLHDDKAEFMNAMAVPGSKPEPETDDK
ncbi:uncharacterized protein LOC116953586 isoform X2 [Petromyzon marinus]|uniref:Uncharacterized protein LOC116953586 isoform X2 n=1 Tax=Petromyzon marinus TaxID=7757 RepID=A0AAJ7XCM5_PETMA|nr:uncharacterized protein LOC116953586 isoform X2 [Petromyzon marinus]